VLALVIAHVDENVVERLERWARGEGEWILLWLLDGAEEVEVFEELYESLRHRSTCMSIS